MNGRSCKGLRSCHLIFEHILNIIWQNFQNSLQICPGHRKPLNFIYVILQAWWWMTWIYILLLYENLYVFVTWQYCIHSLPVQNIMCVGVILGWKKPSCSSAAVHSFAVEWALDEVRADLVGGGALGSVDRATSCHFCCFESFISK